ncbi:MAG: hypothetical protein EOO68_03850 [Moraxellaceae bacterium]|nr:MAG: hypothetical protein EOO68_03850 [Moraxellaceae bacterium]
MNEEPEMENAAMNRLFRPQEMLDGRIVAILKPDGALLGGDMVVVDAQHFYENDLQIPAGGGTGQAQNPISTLPVNINVGENEFSKHGRFSALTPLYDGTQRLLVSWSECRLIEPAAERLVPCTDTWLATEGVIEAAPLYGIWIYNMAQQSQQPVVLAKEGTMFTEPISLEVRAAPAYLQPTTSLTLANENVGSLFIQSVYDMDGVFSGLGSNITSLEAMSQAASEQRPARYIRFIKAVSIPDDETRDGLADNTYGEAIDDGFTGLQEILGYAPIEADGSVYAKVPADVAFTIEILDKDGKRLNFNGGMSHTSWLQVRPGEQRVCQGCHIRSNSLSGHGRNDAQMPAINNVLMSNAQLQSTSVDLNEITSYRNLVAGAGYANLYAPTSEACTELSGWTSLCRITINYEQHIQPLWERSTAAQGNHSCTTCHSPSIEVVDPVTNEPVTIAQIPKGQLNLLRTRDGNSMRMLSYNQLLNGSNRQILDVTGETLMFDIPVCELAPADDYPDIAACIITLDVNGLPTCEGVANCPFEQDPITNAVRLDTLGNPIPRTNIIGVNARLNRGGALANDLFYRRFTETTSSHFGYLNYSELKLLAEWLDLGGRYYNNPFDTIEQ